MSDEFQPPMMPGPQPMMFQGQNPLGYPGQMSETIASMRWESDPLVHQLYRMLGGYEITLDSQNQLVRKRDGKVKPLMNDVGIERVISLIRGLVNPVTALSNIDDEEANELIRQVLYDFILDLVNNKERWSIEDGDMHTVMSIVKSIVFMQLKRAVGGHESTNFRTQTFEQNMQQNYQQSNAQGASILPWKMGSKK